MNPSQANIPEHIKKEELLQKIDDLFSYRMFPWLMSEIDKSEQEKQHFWNHLIDLQESVYYLDAQLESQWNVYEESRIQHWNQIIHCTRLCLSEHIHPLTVLQHIKKYEKHELALRSGRLPVNLSMSYFYFYKSCDVKLLRRLIYDFGGLEKKLGSLASWRLFDFVTEINDDITDVYEDLPFYNGNRFLIHLLLYGKDSTILCFNNFLEQLWAEVDKKLRQNQKNEATTLILENSIIQVEQTISLLKKTIQEVDLSVLNKESVLFPYITEHKRGFKH